ncbi:hypothetical protein ERJ75_000103700 [Trypanosoma vivax]|nr:hypothetical protein TRVL_06076 [Trypanosoma vivax]KAH8609253.1 hypothetical protein ERJ75_001222800 [Trypanosoma vivax]KAH8620051.1 hypothetical protein ERJ75_000103700 [Trypanosoma vivax]
MASEAVKKQILGAINSLNIPLDRSPGTYAVAEACSAAKLLRNRVLREFSRVEKHIIKIRERRFYADSDESESDEGINYDDLGGVTDVRKLSRCDFMFISEMMVMENLVIPLLLAHGMNFTSSLLPQLLKLLAAMLLPVLSFSNEVPRQTDYVRRLVERCGTDEFFTLLIQCVAPVTEKRSTNDLQKEDVVLLEIVLKIITLFFSGPKESVPSVIGAFSRNHGIELFLVILNQNFARNEFRKNKGNEDHDIFRIRPSDTHQEENDSNVVFLSNDEEEESVVELSEEDESEAESSQGGDIPVEPAGVSEHYNARMMEILESDEQLWKWNMHIASAMVSILRCAQSVELAQLVFISKFRQDGSQQVTNLVDGGRQFIECKKESKKWRYLARCHNGATSSNGLLVKGTSSSRIQGEGGAIGYTSTLLGFRGKDSIEKAHDIDSRKKGRYVKGIPDDLAVMCNLSLPTKMQLAQQCLSFICYGFEPLSMMIWSRLASSISSFEDSVQEKNELLASYRTSGEEMETTIDLDSSVYESAQYALNYIGICSSLLRYTREFVMLKKDEKREDLTSFFHQQWKCISSVITQDHIFHGFKLLRVFLSSPHFMKRFGLSNIVLYLAELFMTLNHLVNGDIVDNTDVILAAHALASFVLYTEDNISLIFDAMSRQSGKLLPPVKAGALVLLIYSVLQLMEKCSFGGRLLFPSKKRRKKMVVKVEVDHVASVSGEATPSEKATKDNALDEFNVHTNLPLDEKASDLRATPPSPNNNAEADKGQPVDGSHESIVVDDVSSLESENNYDSISTTDREVNMRSYFRRLSAVRNTSLILSALRNWRANDSDVNTGLVFLIRSFVAEECANVFFSAPFLIVMRDILANGKHSHQNLYEVCDEVVYLFFNPAFAKMLDKRKGDCFGSSSGVLCGAQSFLGFEVALRCARSLFCYSSTEYDLLEEKGIQQTDPDICSLTNVAGVANAVPGSLYVGTPSGVGSHGEQTLPVIEREVSDAVPTENSDRVIIESYEQAPLQEVQ